MNIKIILCLVASTVPLALSTAAFQHFAAYYGSECAAEGDNPILMSSMYSRTCEDYDKKCFDFPQSSTSATAACKPRLTSFPSISGQEDYFTVRIFRKSPDCKADEKSQVIQLRQSDACIPNSMNEEPTEWFLASCGDGEHYFSVCEDEDCSSCQDPYVFEDNSCLQQDGLRASSEKYSMKISCTTLKAGRKIDLKNSEASKNEIKSLDNLPHNILQAFNPNKQSFVKGDSKKVKTGF